jgi:hypothetical protein
MPSDKEEMAKLTKEEKDSITEKVRSRQKAFETQVRYFHD